VAVVSSIALSIPDNYLRNYDVRRKEFGFNQYDPIPADTAGVAILDDGYGITADGQNLDDIIKGALPTDHTTLISHYEPGSFCSDEPAPVVEEEIEKQRLRIESTGLNPKIDHGLKLGMLVWGLLKLNPYGPHFFLMNSHGSANFIKACRCLTKLAKRLGTPAMKNVQRLVVLTTKNFESGDFNGRGYLNKYVDPVLDANPEHPVIWVNAVGNYHQRVLNADLVFDKDGYVRYDEFGGQNFAEIFNHVRNHETRIELSWNSFGPGETKTNKDLDLILEKPNGERMNLVGAQSQDGKLIRYQGRYIQTTNDKLALDETNVPRELITLSLKETIGTYKIYVQAKNPKLFRPKERMRLTIYDAKEGWLDETKYEMRDALELKPISLFEEVPTPADNARVITAGDRNPTSALGPTWDGRTKPEVVVENNRFTFKDNSEFDFSSSASGVIAASVVALLKVRPDLTTPQYLRMTRNVMPYVYIEDAYATPVREVDPKWGKEHFPKILRTLTSKGFEASEITFGQFALPRPENRFVIGVPGDLGRLTSVFEASGVTNLKDRWDKDEFYLEEWVDREAVTGYKRSKEYFKSKDGKTSEVELPPWLYPSNREVPSNRVDQKPREKSPYSFVLLQRTTTPTGGPLHKMRVWRALPDPAKLTKEIF
jgi:hypothetical protein